MIIYTDGVIEALNQDGGIYGESRLLDVTPSPSDAKAIVRAIDADVRTFAAVTHRVTIDDRRVRACANRPIKQG